MSVHDCLSLLQKFIICQSFPPRTLLRFFGTMTGSDFSFPFGIPVIPLGFAYRFFFSGENETSHVAPLIHLNTCYPLRLRRLP